MPHRRKHAVINALDKQPMFLSDLFEAARKLGMSFYDTEHWWVAEEYLIIGLPPRFREVDTSDGVKVYRDTLTGGVRKTNPTLEYYTKLAKSVVAGTPFEFEVPADMAAADKGPEDDALANKETDLAASKPQLIVTILQGRGLIPKDDDGLSDPFCVVKYGNSKYQTQVVPKTLDPVFEDTEVFRFEEISTTQPDLEIVIWDKDTNGADYMGQVELSTKGIHPNEPFEAWVEVEASEAEIKKGARVDGQLKVKIEYKTPNVAWSPARVKNVRRMNVASKFARDAMRKTQDSDVAGGGGGAAGADGSALSASATAASGAVKKKDDGGLKAPSVCTPARTQLFANALQIDFKHKYHWAQMIAQLTLIEDSKWLRVDPKLEFEHTKQILAKWKMELRGVDRQVVTKTLEDGQTVTRSAKYSLLQKWMVFSDPNAAVAGLGSSGIVFHSFYRDVSSNHFPCAMVMDEAANIIQRGWKGRITRRAYYLMKMATRLARFIRKAMAKRREKHHRAATVIQKNFRVYRARRHAGVLRTALKRLVHLSALIIQRVWRGCQGRKVAGEKWNAWMDKELAKHPMFLADEARDRFFPNEGQKRRTRALDNLRAAAPPPPMDASTDGFVEQPSSLSPDMVMMISQGPASYTPPALLSIIIHILKRTGAVVVPTLGSAFLQLCKVPFKQVPLETRKQAESLRAFVVAHPAHFIFNATTQVVQLYKHLVNEPCLVSFLYYIVKTAGNEERYMPRLRHDLAKICGAPFEAMSFGPHYDSVETAREKIALHKGGDEKRAARREHVNQHSPQSDGGGVDSESATQRSRKEAVSPFQEEEESSSVNVKEGNVKAGSSPKTTSTLVRPKALVEREEIRAKQRASYGDVIAQRTGGKTAKRDSLLEFVRQHDDLFSWRRSPNEKEPVIGVKDLSPDLEIRRYGLSLRAYVEEKVLVTLLLHFLRSDEARDIVKRRADMHQVVRASRTAPYGVKQLDAARRLSSGLSASEASRTATMMLSGVGGADDEELSNFETPDMRDLADEDDLSTIDEGSVDGYIAPDGSALGDVSDQFGSMMSQSAEVLDSATPSVPVAYADLFILTMLGVPFERLKYASTFGFDLAAFCDAYPDQLVVVRPSPHSKRAFVRARYAKTEPGGAGERMGDSPFKSNFPKAGDAPEFQANAMQRSPDGAVVFPKLSAMALPSVVQVRFDNVMVNLDRLRRGRKGVRYERVCTDLCQRIITYVLRVAKPPMPEIRKDVLRSTTLPELMRMTEAAVHNHLSSQHDRYSGAAEDARRDAEAALLTGASLNPVPLLDFNVIHGGGGGGGGARPSSR